MATWFTPEYEICWLQPNGSITFSALKAEWEATTLWFHKEYQYFIPYEWLN